MQDALDVEFTKEAALLSRFLGHDKVTRARSTCPRAKTSYGFPFETFQAETPRRYGCQRKSQWDMSGTSYRAYLSASTEAFNSWSGFLVSVSRLPHEQGKDLFFRNLYANTFQNYRLPSSAPFPKLHSHRPVHTPYRAPAWYTLFSSPSTPSYTWLWTPS